MSVSTNFALYLSPEGYSVKIENIKDKGYQATSEQREALACRTHREVLAFLEKIKASSIKDSFSFFHRNNVFYAEHLTGDWGSPAVYGTHSCSLDKQIDFIRYRMAEQVHGIRRHDSSYGLCRYDD